MILCLIPNRADNENILISIEAVQASELVVGVSLQLLTMIIKWTKMSVDRFNATLNDG